MTRIDELLGDQLGSVPESVPLGDPARAWDTAQTRRKAPPLVLGFSAGGLLAAAAAVLILAFPGTEDRPAMVRDQVGWEVQAVLANLDGEATPAPVGPIAEAVAQDLGAPEPSL